MKKIVLMLMVLILFVSGCGWYGNRKYSGKIFDVKAYFVEGRKWTAQVWHNACELNYNPEEREYTFYVDGKLVVIDSPDTVVITEIGTPPTLSLQEERYKDKMFNIKIVYENKITKAWNNIQLLFADEDLIKFIDNGKYKSIRPANDVSVIIEEKQ